MPSAVYLHDGEHQITVTFRTEQDKERFKAHYRTLDALGVQYRDERDAALALAERRAGERDRMRALVVDAAKYLADSEDGDAYPLYERLHDALAAAPPPASE